MCNLRWYPLSMFATLTALLVRRAATTPDRIALIHEGCEYCYAELHRLSWCYARALCEHGAAGGRVLLLLDNGPAFFGAFFGTLLTGGVPVPLAPKSSSERLAYIATDCSASAIILEPATRARPGSGPDPAACRALYLAIAEAEATPAEPPPALPNNHPDATACIQYTSGSTGQSKGVVLSQRAVMANIRGFTRLMAIDPARDVFSSMMPLFHDMGLLCFGLAPLYLGVPLVLYRQEALSLYRWLEGIGHYRVTITGGPNTLLQLALRVVERKEDYNLSSLRMLICGSEPVRAETVRQFEEQFHIPGRVKPAYGMAELSLCATLTAVDESFQVDTAGIVSCGRPLEGVQIRVRPDGGDVSEQPGVIGELLIRSPACMDGYLNRPSAETLTADGWLPTGDAGYLDAAGRLYVLGRLKNLIVRGGEKFSPHDSETIALQHPEIRQAAVITVESPASGDATTVAILEVNKPLLKERDRLATLAKAIHGESQRRASYAPQRFAFVPAGTLPVTENGKIRYPALRESLQTGGLVVPVSLLEDELERLITRERVS